MELCLKSGQVTSMPVHLRAPLWCMVWRPKDKGHRNNLDPNQKVPFQQTGRSFGTVSLGKVSFLERCGHLICITRITKRQSWMKLKYRKIPTAFLSVLIAAVQHVFLVIVSRSILIYKEKMIKRIRATKKEILCKTPTPLSSFPTPKEMSTFGISIKWSTLYFSPLL